MVASDTLKKVAIAPAVGARLPAIDDGAVCQMHRHRWPRNLGVGAAEGCESGVDLKSIRSLRQLLQRWTT